MSDENERSVASAGSVAGEPAAWGVLRVGGRFVSILANEVQAETSRKSFDQSENWVHEVVPLYRSPTLTDAEREAVRFCVTACLPETEKLGGVVAELCRMHATTLRGLLERIG